MRKADHAPTGEIGFRHLWGQAKCEELLETAEAEPGNIYESIEPVLPLGLPFAQTAVSEDWFDWPALPDLFPVSFPGVKTSRNGFLIDIDLDPLKARIADYFNADLRHEEITRRHPAIMKESAQFDPEAVRDELLARGGPNQAGFIRHTYRPFDNRWLYWEADSTLLDRPRPQYKPHLFEGNLWLSAAQHLRRDANEPQACFTKIMGSGHLIERGASMFPAYLREEGDLGNGGQAGHRPNLAPTAQRYLKHLGATVEDLFYHVLATLHDPTYRQANAGALKMEWPRIPLPGWPDGEANGAAEILTASAARGRELARLLDPDAPVPGVTQGTLCPEIAALAVPATTDGRNMTTDDFALTAGWGHYGTGDAVMPGQGRIVEREYTKEERVVLGDAISVLGAKTLDVYLNDHAFWRNVPAAIWNYKLGGYQVLKKWLSYREHDVLGRMLTPEEVLYFAEMTRRVGTILQVTGKAFVVQN